MDVAKKRNKKVRFQALERFGDRGMFQERNLEGAPTSTLVLWSSEITSRAKEPLASLYQVPSMTELGTEQAQWWVSLGL